MPSDGMPQIIKSEQSFRPCVMGLLTLLLCEMVKGQRSEVYGVIIALKAQKHMVLSLISPYLPLISLNFSSLISSLFLSSGFSSLIVSVFAFAAVASVFSSMPAILLSEF